MKKLTVEECFEWNENGLSTEVTFEGREYLADMMHSVIDNCINILFDSWMAYEFINHYHTYYVKHDYQRFNKGDTFEDIMVKLITEYGKSVINSLYDGIADLKESIKMLDVEA